MQITAKRNYWRHVCYRDFIYIDDWMKSEEYEKVSRKLRNDFNRLSAVYKNVEEVKMKANDVYKRV